MKKYKNYFYNTLLTIGIVIGVGIFFKNRSIISAAHGDTTIIISGWFIGGFISLASAVAFSLLSFKVKHSDNGSAEFVRFAFGEKKGFISKWGFILIYFPIYIFVIAIFSSIHLLNLFSMSSNEWYYPIILFSTTFFSIILFTLIIKHKEKIMKVFNLSSTLIKLIPFMILIIIAISALFTNNDNSYWNGNPQVDPKELSPTMYNQTSSMSTIAIIFWIIPSIKFAFDGFISVTSNKRSSSPRSLSLGITTGMIIVTVIFILTAVAILKEGVSSVPEAIISFLGGDINNLSTGYIIIKKIILIIITLSGFGSMAGFMILWNKMAIQVCDDEKIERRHNWKILLTALIFSTLPWVLLSALLISTDVGEISKSGTDVVDEISNIVLLFSFALNAAILVKIIYLIITKKATLSWVFIISAILSIAGISLVVIWDVVDNLLLQSIYHGSEPGLFGWDKWCYPIIFVSVILQILMTPVIGKLSVKLFKKQEIKK